MSAVESNECNDIISQPRSRSTVVSRVNVIPLITPRYQKKQRMNKRIEVTDTSVDVISATAALRKHTKEVLTVHNGPISYEQEMYFHPHELYKHGKYRIYTSSVGYASDGDLVIERKTISEPSDADLGFVRLHSEIDKAICLDPKAQRPFREMKDSEKKNSHQCRKKYPGICAPKNRKVRNRLLNDYFANEYARKIMDKYRERQATGEGEDDTSPPIRPAFGKLPSVFYDMLELDEDAQTRALERCAAAAELRSAANVAPKDPDSGEARFQEINSRLRSELVHALNSVFLTRQIDDLEHAFARFITEGNADKSLVYNFRDGYGRLVCHGVAAYYKLLSQSQHQRDGGSKITVVSWPKKKKKRSGISTPLKLPHTPLLQLLRKKSNDMQSFLLVPTPQNTPLINAAECNISSASFSLDDARTDCDSSVGLTAAQNCENLAVVVGGGGISEDVVVYEPPCKNSSVGAAVMTATQRKKMRKAMRAAQREAAAAAVEKNSTTSSVYGSTCE